MAVGDVTGPIDTLKWEAAVNYYPSACHIAGNKYVIASDPVAGIHIYTVQIDANGTIADSVIAHGEIDPDQAKAPIIIKVAANVFAVVYYTFNKHGRLRTIGINDDGTIDNLSIDFLQFNTSETTYPHIIHVAGDIYAIAAQGAGEDGFIYTVEITSNGSIPGTVTDSWEYNTGNSGNCKIIKVADTTYAITNIDDVNDGWIRTLTIHDTGVIVESIINAHEFEGASCYWPKIIRVHPGVFAIVYHDGNNYGWLQSIKISDAGAISTTGCETLKYADTQGKTPDIALPGAPMVLLLQCEGTNYLKARTANITSTGDIVTPFYGTWTIEDSSTSSPFILHISGDMWACAYKIVNEGWLATFSVNAGVKPHHEMLLGIGP